MLLEPGTQENTFSNSPTRQFAFVLDPECVPLVQMTAYGSILDMISELKNANPPVEIYIYFPTFLADAATRTLADRMQAAFVQVTEPKSVEAFTPDAAIHKDYRDRLLENNDRSQRALSLLSLASFARADGIVTLPGVLVDARYALYNHHQIRIIPLDEFAELVEVCAHGHSIFWSASNPIRGLTFDTFYQMTHWKNARLAKWFNAIQVKMTNDELKENLRSALLNRYPFLLYSRDMVRFYQLQRDFYSRRGLQQMFGMAIGYFVTAFYLLLWGMLDHLTVIAKHARGIELDERFCGIKSKDFWDVFGPQEPALQKFILCEVWDGWITMMADMRHAAAHRVIAVPGPLLAETEDSKKSHEEILEITRKDYEDLYSIFPEEFMKGLEPMMVQNYRISKMKPLAQSIVAIKTKDGGYMRDPVGSIDFDLARATVVLDAFLVRLFG